VRRLALSLLLAVAGAAAAAADRQPLPPPGGAAPAEAAGAGSLDAALAGLLELPGNWVDVRYPADHLDRAARLQMRFDALHQTLQPLTRTRLEWRAAAVGRSRFERLAPGVPWGYPARVGRTLFVVPAAGDAATVAAAFAMLGGAPPDPGGEPLAGTREEAGSLLVTDLLLQLEAARAFADAARIAGDEPWVRELVVHLALRYVWESLERDLVLSRVALFDRVTAAQGGARARRLADFAPGLPRTTDLWYQAQFVRGADAIWIDKGRLGVARLLDRWADSRRPVKRAELEKKFPALVDWQHAAFAP
jgi:hypothetical protein